MHQPHIPPGGRYPVLRTIAILWLVGAVISLIGGVYQAIAALAGLRAQEWVNIGGLTLGGRVMAFFIWLAATFFLVIVDIAIAELIKLAIDVEHNTRLTATNTAAPGGATPAPAGAAGAVVGGRMAALGDINEESAEAALIRGH
ncbi:MAG TPA: hypothetical protein VGI81_26835 [Tepidisphaeraceae bacterium]|jgi:hypothetical protein